MMKRIKYVLLMVVALSLVTAMTAFAGPAYQASFTTSITYQNVGSQDADVTFSFFPENNGTPISVNRTLPAGAGASLFVGSLDDIAPGFGGSAVLSSDQPVVATLVQISSDPAVKNRPLSNGFASGSPEVLLATVLKNQFNSTTRFSVQNASSSAVDLTVEIYNAANPMAAPITVTHNNLPAGAAKYFDMGTLSQVTASSFNGSAVIMAVETGTSNPASIVATALELGTNNATASAFEGVANGATTVFMPSALCNAFGGQNSAYAIQNTADAQANVTVEFSNGNEVPLVIAPGAKASVQGCSGGNPAGFNGSATITSNQDIVVIGKVFGLGLSTAFVGDPSGADTLALPYVRWTTAQWTNGARQRTFLALQNVGAPLPAGEVVVKYINRDGDVVGTHTLGAMATGAKLNSNASQATVAAGFTQADLNEFGYVGGFGGSVIIEGPSGSQLVAIARVASMDGAQMVGEDYNGIPLD